MSKRIPRLSITWQLKFIMEEQPSTFREVGWKFRVIFRITFVLVFVHGIGTTSSIALQTTEITPVLLPDHRDCTSTSCAVDYSLFSFIEAWWLFPVIFPLVSGITAVIWICSLHVFSTTCLFLIGSFESLVLRLSRKRSFGSFLSATVCEYERISKVMSNVNELYCGYTLALLTTNLPLSLSMLYIITIDREMGILQECRPHSGS